MAKPGDDTVRGQHDVSTLYAKEDAEGLRQQGEYTKVDQPDTEKSSIRDDRDATPDLAPSPAPPSLPDGGFTAWLQCAGSFFMFFNCWGVVNSFGESLSSTY